MLKTVKTRLLAVVMAMVLIVGCIPAITLDVVADAAPAVYYLKGGATDGDGSADAPFGTTTEVVNAIKDAGQNVAGNVITVKVIKSDSNVGFGEANALYVNPYSYTSGGSTYSGVLLHDATIVYESADPENRASMFSADATAYYFTFLRLGGPTVFRNIDLRINRTSGQWLEFFSNGYSATYEKYV